VSLPRFPYAVFFQPSGERLIIVAVLHQARDPEMLDRR
jgi:plasmid stabilization system protein ParE